MDSEVIGNDVAQRLLTIKPNEQITFGLLDGVRGKKVAPEIQNLVSQLIQEKQLLRFMRRIKRTHDFEYIAVGVTPLICDRLEQLVKKFEDDRYQKIRSKK